MIREQTAIFRSPFDYVNFAVPARNEKLTYWVHIFWHDLSADNLYTTNIFFGCQFVIRVFASFR
jgi:hypothetical protein